MVILSVKNLINIKEVSYGIIGSGGIFREKEKIGELEVIEGTD
jgi:hypothetical protein